MPRSKLQPLSDAERAELGAWLAEHRESLPPSVRTALEQHQALCEGLHGSRHKLSQVLFELRRALGIKAMSERRLSKDPLGPLCGKSVGVCAAMLADVLTGESPVGVALPGSTVVISAVKKGDQPDESADVKALVGWCAGIPEHRSDPPGGRANEQAVAKTESEPGDPETTIPPEADGGAFERAEPQILEAKAIVVGEEWNWERAADEHSGGIEDGMSGKSGQRKHGTTRGSPRRSRTAKASRITGTAGKSRRACEWGGWGRVSEDGPGQNNPDRSEGPWGRAAGAARMAASDRAGFLDMDRGFGAATEDANVGCKPVHEQGTPGGGLICECEGKATTERPALEPYWGKLAVRNLRGDDGNVGIIRSPVRAIVLPDYRSETPLSPCRQTLARA